MPDRINNRVHEGILIINRTKPAKGLIIRIDNKDNWADCVDCFSAITPDNQNQSL